VEKSAGEEDPLLLVDPLQELFIETVERGTVLQSRRNPAEGEERKLGLGEDLNAGDGAQLVRRPARQVELLVQRVAEGADAVHLDRQPDAQAAERAGQLGGQ